MEFVQLPIPNYSVGILVVSDTVSTGEKLDASGKKLVEILKTGHYFHVNVLHEECVSDDFDKIQNKLKYLVDDLNVDLILTVGGTGFTERDVTPEATKGVLDREAPHLASRMILGCCEKTPFSVLSRSTSGIRGRSLILNLPGSAKGAQECFEMIAEVIPHALDQLKGKLKRVSDLHCKIQTSDAEQFSK